MTAVEPCDSREYGKARPSHVRLLLIRHGATTGSARHVLAGRTDVDLSPVGRRQARELAAYLTACPVAAVYSSPQKRAHQTARALAARFPLARLILCPDLREVDLGMLEGYTAGDAWRRWPDLFRTALDPATGDFAFPDGESWSAAEGRARRALSAIVQAHRVGDTVAVVTHGAILGLLFAHFSGEPRGSWRRYQPRHGSVSSAAARMRESGLWLLPVSLDVSAFFTRRLQTAVILRKAMPPGQAADREPRAWRVRPTGRGLGLMARDDHA